jgi:hypothetical protein
MQGLWIKSPAPSLKPLRKGESINEAVVNGNFLQKLPNFVRMAMAWMLRHYSSPAGRNDDWATILEGFGLCPSINDERELFVKQETYLAEWNKSLNENDLDFVLALPFPMPAIPRNSTGKVTILSAAGCLIFNLVRSSSNTQGSTDRLILLFFSLIIRPVVCPSRSWTRTSIHFPATSPPARNTPT